MNRSQRLLATLLLFSLTTFIAAQTTVSGVVTDAKTGDVLAGLIGSFLSQGLNPIDSCKTAVGLHGYCGDLFKDRNFSAYELVNKIAQERFSLSPQN